LHRCSVFVGALRSAAWALLGQRWKSCLLRGSQLVRRRGQPVAATAAGGWHFALGDELGSACLLWPAVQGRLPGCGEAGAYFTPKATEMLHWGVVVNWDDWESWPYEWRSPMWQWLEFPRAREHGSAAFQQVRAFPTLAQPQGLLVSASQAWFWDIGVTTLRAIGAALGIREAGETRLFGVLCSLLEKVLGCTEAERLAIVSRRLGRVGAARSAGVAELLTLDDGLDLCTPDDRRQIKTEQQAMRAEEEEQPKIRSNPIPPTTPPRCKGT